MVFMSNHMSNQPVKCFGGMPKWVCDPSTHEVMRFAKCDNAGKLEYISMRLVNKTGLYQDDLYVPTKSQKPCAKYEDWAQGKELTPNLMKITEDYRFVAGEDEEVKLESKDPNVVALQRAKTRIQELEDELEVAKVQSTMSLERIHSEAIPNTKPMEKETIVQEKIVEKIVEKVVEVQRPWHNLDVKSKPVLGYWNIRGLGAQIRYLFHYAGVQFEDKQYAYGPAPDFSRDEWFDVKHKLGLEFPNLPYLLDEPTADGHKIKLTETMAIMKYVCAKWAPELY